jgi:hypothetical protein
MTRAVLAGGDPNRLGDALEADGARVTRAGGTAARGALETAGITDADLFVLTDARLATSIPVAKDLNPDIRVIVYTQDSLPEFARGQAGHIVDPRLLDVQTVSEELI